mgnify:CR=1 FL=1
MSQDYIIGAISTSAATSYTGSFVKIHAMGSQATASSHTLTNVVLGSPQSPHTGSWPNNSGILNNITLSQGNPIELPIQGFKTPADAAGIGFLAYFTKNDIQ